MSVNFKCITLRSFCALGLFASMLSCTQMDVKDVYEGPTVESGNNPLSNLRPSADFTWRTFIEGSLTIQVDDQYDSQYDYYVKVYSQFPVDDQVTPLTFGTARGDQPLQTKVDVPNGVSALFVKVTDPTGAEFVYTFAAPENGKNVEYKCVRSDENASEQATRVFVSNSGANVAEKPELHLTPRENVKSLKDAEFTRDGSDGNLVADGDFVVEANTTFEPGFNLIFKSVTDKQLRIYVYGTLKTGGLELENAELYVMPGGFVDIYDASYSEGAVLYIAKNSTLKTTYVMQYLHGYGDVVVAGTLAVCNTMRLTDYRCNIFVEKTGIIAGYDPNKEFEVSTEFVPALDIYGTFDVEGEAHFCFLDMDDSESNQTDSGSNYVPTVTVHKDALLDVKVNAIINGTINNSGTIHARTLRGTYSLSAQAAGRTIKEATLNSSGTLLVQDDISDFYKYNIGGLVVSNILGTDEDGILKCEPVKLITSGSDSYMNLSGAYIYAKSFRTGDSTISGGFIQCTDTFAICLPSVQGAIRYATVEANHWVNFSGGDPLESFYDYPDGHPYSDLLQGTVFSKPYTNNIDIVQRAGVIRKKKDLPADYQPESGNNIKGRCTISFEDQWPSFGDYDLNDVVLHLDDIDIVEDKGYIQSATFNLELSALGASYKLGAGIQLDEVTNDQVESVSYTTMGEPGFTNRSKGAFKLANNGAEEGAGTDPVIVPLFYNGHEYLRRQTGLSNAQYRPTNTQKGETTVSARKPVFTIHFKSGSKITAEQLRISALNFFIFRPDDKAAINGKRVEIHLYDMEPTRWATTHYNGMADDSNGRYKSGKFSWGLLVNDKTFSSGKYEVWKCPSEKQLITDAYPEFGSYVYYFHYGTWW